MKWQDAKRIPLTALLASLGHEVSHTSAGGRQVWYASPFRSETQPSFNVNIEKNIWHDLGLGQGGTVLDFVLRYYGLASVSEALGKLDDLGYGNKPASLFAPAARAVAPPAPSVQTKASGITLKKVQPLQNKALIQYLDTRAIPVAIARAHVQEAYYTVVGRNRTYFALAFPSRSGGYELRNQYFKGGYGAKDISLMAGPKNGTVAIFEGFIDFLSWLAYTGKVHPPCATLVLNSTAMKDPAVETIQELGVETVALYLDHDETGRQLSEELKASLAGLEIVDKSTLYQGFEDFNAFLQKISTNHLKVK